LTVTFSPGAAVPQMGTGMSRCKTMWLLSTGGSFTSARVAGTKATLNARVARMRIMRHLKEMELG
jgi:hypothetical protein